MDLNTKIFVLSKNHYNHFLLSGLVVGNTHLGLRTQKNKNVKFSAEFLVASIVSENCHIASNLIPP